eukprot:442903_1
MSEEKSVNSSQTSFKHKGTIWYLNITWNDYQKRYVKISNNNSLMIFKKKASRDILDSFNLSLYNKVKIVNTDKFEFQISSKSSKNMKFKATSLKKMHEWINVMKNCLQNNNPNKNSKSSSKRHNIKKRHIQNYTINKQPTKSTAITSKKHCNLVQKQSKCPRLKPIQLTWRNVAHGIEHEISKSISSTITKIINNKKYNIKLNDLSNKTLRLVLDIIRIEKPYMIESEVMYIAKFFRRAQQFKPVQLQTDKQLKPLKLPSRFEYKSDNDINGLLYYLGCNGEVIKTAYRNPMEMNFIVVESSKLNHNIRSLKTLFERDETGVTTKINKHSFVKINLKKIKIKLSCYTLMNYGSNNALKNWNLEGSNDDKSWRIISKHSNEKTLKLNDVHTWNIKYCDYYSYFRLKLTGTNCS